MHLSNEEKRSILEESQDTQLQEDLRLPVKPHKMGLAEYLEFLTILWKSTPRQSQDRKFVPYKKVIF